MSRSSNSTNERFSDEKEHYASLIELFKYSITIISSIFVLIGLAVGFITYTDGKELREKQALERKELISNLAELKSELKDSKAELLVKSQGMRSDLQDQIALMRTEVEASRVRAQNEILNFKNIATNEARARINEVFDRNNFDQFVENVAITRIEPQIESLVDDRFEMQRKNRIHSTNQAIEDLTSTNRMEVSKALTNLQLNRQEPLDEYQIKNIVNKLETGKIEKDYWNSIYLIIGQNPTKSSAEFFKRSLLTPQSDQLLELTALQYLMGYVSDLGVDFYFNLFETRSPNFFNTLIETSSLTNKDLMKGLLDSKKFADKLRSQLTTNEFGAFKENVKFTISRNYKFVDFQDLYLFKSN